MRKIVFFDVKKYEEKFIDNLDLDGFDVLKIESNFQDALPLKIEEVCDAEVISVFTNSRLTCKNLKHMKNLKLITTRSTGFSHIDLDYCKENSIKVLNVPSYGTITVAEYAFALLLSVVRNIKLSSDDLRKSKITPEKYIGIDLFGKEVGVIGTGAIGGHFCKIANGFGMKIVAYDPYPDLGLSEKFGVEYMDLDTLLSRSDIISFHAPSTARNVHMVDYEQFKIMKDGVIIVNTARGELMNTEALYEALLSGKVAFAALDVVECEEILSSKDGKKFLEKVDCKIQSCLEKTFINHKLLTMDNVIVTPHMAYDSKEAIGRILKTTGDNIYSYIEGNIKNSVL